MEYSRRDRPGNRGLPLLIAADVTGIRTDRLGLQLAYDPQHPLVTKFSTVQRTPIYGGSFRICIYLNVVWRGCQLENELLKHPQWQNGHYLDLFEKYDIGEKREKMRKNGIILKNIRNHPVKTDLDTRNYLARCHLDSSACSKSVKICANRFL